MIVRQVSSLEKILRTGNTNISEVSYISGLCGERISYQLAYSTDVAVVAEVAVHSPLPTTLYRVESVVNGLHKYPYINDETYIDAPLIPDVLFPMTDNDVIRPLCHQWLSLWVTIDIPKDAKAGTYQVDISFIQNGEVLLKAMCIEIIGVQLPTQDICVTQWVHCDCIADIHGVPIFSEAHWALMEKYIAMAVSTGSNMILTPVLGLCTDISPTTERPTLQLVDIDLKDGTYTFHFERLTRWIAMCQRVGMQYFEISHLFSQWGAKGAPKIIVRENGVETKRFDVHTDSASDAYKTFLQAFLGALTAYFIQAGLQENVYFHVSDEPSAPDAERYLAAYNLVLPLLHGFKIMDAHSDYALHQRCKNQIAIPGLNIVEEFIQKGVKERWTYYCCSQSEGLPNKFLALPATRNRILGTLLYKFEIDGFLHWGFNFYYSQFSKRLINPYTVTDSDGAFPSGDPFVVYPFADTVLYSTRALVFAEGLQDLRALRLLEQYRGRTETMRLPDPAGTLTFRTYPRSAQDVLLLRERINQEIRACITT